MKGFQNPGAVASQALKGIVHGDNQCHRNDNESGQHNQGLENVGAGHGQKTANESVGHDGNQGDEHAKVVAGALGVKAKHHFQQLCPGDKAGTDVQGYEVNANQTRQRAQQPAGISKSILQELGKGQGVFRRQAVPADSAGQDGPGKPVSQDNAGDRPQVHHAGGEGQGGQYQHWSSRWWRKRRRLGPR